MGVEVFVGVGVGVGSQIHGLLYETLVTCWPVIELFCIHIPLKTYPVPDIYGPAYSQPPQQFSYSITALSQVISNVA